MCLGVKNNQKEKIKFKYLIQLPLILQITLLGPVQKPFICIISFNLCNTFVSWVLLICPFHMWESKTEREGNTLTAP